MAVESASDLFLDLNAEHDSSYEIIIRVTTAIFPR